MSILKRFSDLMKANVNTVLEKAEGEHADILLEQYIREAREDLENVKSETAGVIADETAAGRRVAALADEAAKLATYAEKAVLAGNDDDARRFLEGKASAEATRLEAEAAYAQAQQNSDRMRQLTKKLSADIIEAQGRLDELKGKLSVVKQQEKMNDLSERISSMGGEFTDYDRLADAVQKRIDEVGAKAQLDAELSASSDMDSLKKKYADAEDNTSAGIDAELAAIKAKLGK